jgi:hypothetical protein
LEQDELLKLDVLERVIVKHDILSDALHRVVCLVLRKIYEVDLPETTLAKVTN